jgi:stalled ribosome rescue protein Dom34
MNDIHHAIVWIDHSEARVFRFDDGEERAVHLHSHTSLQRLHHRATGWEAGGNPPDDTEFYRRILAALDATGGIVITGPGSAKDGFKAFLDRFQPGVAARVCALEPLDQPGAEALQSLGTRYFKEETRPEPSNVN